MIPTAGIQAIPPRTASNREAICLGCREKLCCTYYTVTVTARDVWRIIQALQLGVSDFLRYAETADERPGRFLLRPEGPFCDLVLAKRPGDGPSPCVFLLRTGDGHGVCGLGDLRPGECRAYPVYLRHGLVRLVNDRDGCVRSWSYAEVDLDHEHARLRGLDAERQEHLRVVAEWNRAVRTDGHQRTFDEFCAYLVGRCVEAEEAS
jgi:Fe-S-cluster containining protein